MGIYMMRLWEHLVRDQPKATTLPPIVPVLVHHSDTGWTAATAFQDVIAVEPALLPAMRPYIPHFELRLIDISEGQASQLVDQALTALGRVALWCMSVADDEERLARELDRISAALEEILAAPNGQAALGVLLRYLLATHTRLDVEKVGKLIEKTGRASRTVLGVWTELDEIELRAELKGRAKQLLLQLTARFGTVSPEVAAKIEAASERLLDRWTVRVLTAATPEEVVASGKDGAGRRAAVADKPKTRTPKTRTRAGLGARASQGRG